MTEESRQQTDGAGMVVIVLALALFALGIWAGRVTGTSESDRDLIKSQKEQIAQLQTELVETRGRLDGYREGRR